MSDLLNDSKRVLQALGQVVKQARNEGRKEVSLPLERLNEVGLLLLDLHERVKLLDRGDRVVPLPWAKDMG